MTIERAEAFALAGQLTRPGQRHCVELPLPRLYTHTPMTMPVHVLHGSQPGPRLFVTAALHGDELNGVEIVRQVLEHPRLRHPEQMFGTLLAVPVVNVFGFLNQSRYLPDRRDLNRSFPGSARGSMASRLAHVLMQSVVGDSDFGIDLHTAAGARDNLPQVRFDSSRHPVAVPLAHAFAAPANLDSKAAKGTLRWGAREVPVILYEAGEALRLDATAIEVGVNGVLQAMESLGMLAPVGTSLAASGLHLLQSSRWVRASHSGMLRSAASLGDTVEKGQVLGVIGDPYGLPSTRQHKVLCPMDGLLIGVTRLPLVHAGEALFHVAGKAVTLPVNTT